MTLETATRTIEEKLHYASMIDARIKIDFGDDGVIYVDATQNPAVISHDDKEADTTLVCTLETFEGILNGTQDPNIAFMTGKLKVKGSVGVAMKLNSLLED